MYTVTSSDGSSLAVWRSGFGSPLLLVHGTVASHATTWRFVQPEFDRHFTVYAMDRRGRGGSGDSAQYSLKQEAEDICAVIETIGEPVDVLGHSFGGLCALEAALLTSAMRRLILYESVPLRGADNYPPGAIEELEALVAANQVDAALETMLRVVVGLDSNAVDALRAQPEAWAIRLANTAAMPRELRAEEEYVFALDRFHQMCVPTLLLVGAESAPRELLNAQTVAEALPRAQIRLLAGQQHLAMYTAPEMFAGVVLQFLAET